MTPSDAETSPERRPSMPALVFSFLQRSSAIMADQLVLTTKPRTQRGSRAAAKLRASGELPAVLYGHKEETVALTISAEALQNVIRHKARVVDLESGGSETQKALIREIQWDHLGKDVLHVDFERVSAHERIHVSVPIELRGIAPGVTGGGVLDQPMHTLPIECPAISVPESIRVNVGELQLGAAIHVRDLSLPEGVTTSADPDALVVHVTLKQIEAEPVVAPAPGAAEPEVIGRKVEEGEEEKE
jgi:large subunit ribosomal protein L25